MSDDLTPTGAPEAAETAEAIAAAENEGGAVDVIESPPPRPMEPVQSDERVTIIDVLRGIALFGILTANMRGFAGPGSAYFNASIFWKDPTDLFVQKLIDTFVQGKFITIFAFLFGVGFTVQFTRAEARGTKFGRWYPRRLFSLLLIGLAHQVFLWWGDILVAYALTGFALILFRKRTNKTILIWALALNLSPFLIGGAGAAFQQFRPQPQQTAEEKAKKKQERERKRDERLRETVKAYQSGTPIDIVKTRFEEVKPAYFGMPFYLPGILGLFLLGMWTWRKGIFQDPQANRSQLLRGLWIGAILGVGGSVVLNFVLKASENIEGTPSPIQIVGFLLRVFVTPAHSMFYVCAIVLLYQTEMGRRMMTPFAAVGRTALSSYLGQSLIATTLFYSYGGGLFGKYGPAWLLLPTVVIYGLQVPLANWWLTKYRFGPMEWVWRSMTYGKLQPMQK